MKPKTFLFLGLLFTLVLLISSDKATEKPQAEEKTDEVKEPNQGGKSCRGQGGCCRWSHKGYGCIQCCHSAANEASKAYQVNGGWGGGYGGYGGYGGGYGGYGGWGGGYGGGWGRPWGGGWGRGCGWGYCGEYCCGSAAEARAYNMANTEAEADRANP